MTQSKINEYLLNPVLAAEQLLGETGVDPYGLNFMWVMPRVHCSDGASPSVWLCVVLRAILMSDHHVGIYAPRYDQAKRWFRQFSLARYTKSKAQLRSSPSETVIKFQNGSLVMIPAPNFRTLIGFGPPEYRFNDIVFLNTDLLEDNDRSMAIGRCTRECKDPKHPIFQNHIIACGGENVTHYPTL